MPIVQQEPRLLDPRQRLRVARNDSLRSDRSDKRVSFNKDVGVKHIPRGQKNPQPKNKEDEWAHCKPVHLRKSHLSPQELEEQAEELVRLIDGVNCVADTKPIKKSIFSTQSLERNKKNKSNNIKTLNNEKNKLINNTNSLNRKLIGSSTNKENINNLSNNIKAKEGNLPYKKFSSPYKSVPNIPTTIFYNNTKPPPKYLLDNKIYENQNFKSVDNLYDFKRDNFSDSSVSPDTNRYRSVDNLTKFNTPASKNYFETKNNTYENIKPSYSSNIIMPETRSPYSRFGSGNRATDSESSDRRVRTHKIYMEDSPQSSRRNFSDHSNNNKQFRYSSAPLSSLEELRRASPMREIPVRREGKSYVHVNKPERRSQSLIKDHDRMSKNNDSDYSAKIIITGNNPNNRYDDDHAYETYQFGGGPFSKASRYYGISGDDSFEDYNNFSNNNMNMSSIGVQTERVPKAPQRTRRNQRSSMNFKEDYDEAELKQDLPSASLVRRINHGFGRIDRSPSPPNIKRMTSNREPRNVVPLLSDTDDSEYNYRRSVDPLAKIRNQVMSRDKLLEERESIEREEERYNRKNQTLNEYHHSTMQPFTVDDIDALTKEVDKKDRSSRIITHENNSYSKNNNYKSNNEDYDKNKNEFTLSRGRKTENDKNDKNARERNKSPGIFSTLEKIKNNNFMSTLERNKAKDKKKKKIKIKFFYDPRPQDENNEDPLNRYTEYKGDYSDNTEMSKNKRDDEVDSYEKGHSDYDVNHSSRSRDLYREKNDRYRYDSSESPIRSDSKPPRYADSSHERSRYTRDSSAETSRKNYQNSTDIRNKGIRQPSYDSSLERRMARNQKNNLRNTDYSNGSSKRNTRTQMESGSRYSSNRHSDHDEIHSKEKKPYAKRLEFSDDTDHRDHSDHGQRSLSQKYKSLSRNDSPSPQKTILRNGEKSELEEVDKNEKIERQRKKFFGVLMGEGKAKYPSPPREVSKDRAQSADHKSSTLTKKGTKQEQSSHRSSREPSSPKISPKTAKEKKQQSKAPIKPKKSRAWPWSFLGLKRSTSQKSSKAPSHPRYPRSSRAPSRASSRASSNPRRPTVRASKIRKDVIDGRPHISRDREADDREKRHWESATHVRSHSSPREIRRDYSPPHKEKASSRYNNKYAFDSSPSTPSGPARRVGRNPSFQERYLSDKDSDRGRQVMSSTNINGNYQSLPNRKARTHGSHQNLGPKRIGGIRKPSPGARGSAGSSLQSSESEADSHGGSHASRASHISTGSNRSVYLHATAVADIPVRRSSDESPSERGISRQSRKVARSFSLVSPWKPRHYREKYEVEYDNREARDAADHKDGRGIEKKNALPPRPPRKIIESDEAPKKMGRSQTVYKDSKLAGWLKRKKNKEVKGI